jgi:hypothetical protein
MAFLLIKVIIMTKRLPPFKKELAEQAYGLCLLGYDDSQLAATFNVDESVIEAWTKNHPKFRDALHEARKLADANVMYALYQLATGWIDIHTGNQMPPNVRAIELWFELRANRNAQH